MLRGVKKEVAAVAAVIAPTVAGAGDAGEIEEPEGTPLDSGMCVCIQ